MSVVILIGFVVTTIVVLISLTWWMYYYHLVSECYLHPNIWCWTDWTCPSGNSPSDYRCPAQTVYNCKSGVTRDDDYCSNDGAGTLGCICKYTSDDDSPCVCEWQGGSWTGDTGTCGTKYCAGDVDSLDNCGPVQ